MKRILALFSVLFCMIVAIPVMSGNTAPVVVVEAGGVDNIWDEMNITEDGEFNPGMANNPSAEANMGKITDKYKSVAQIIIGLLLITTFCGMVYQFTKLAMAGDNDQMRKNAIKGIFVCGFGLSLMGAAELIITVFWSALTN